MAKRVGARTQRGWPDMHPAVRGAGAPARPESPDRGLAECARSRRRQARRPAAADRRARGLGSVLGQGADGRAGHLPAELGFGVGEIIKSSSDQTRRRASGVDASSLRKQVGPSSSDRRTLGEKNVGAGGQLRRRTRRDLRAPRSALGPRLRPAATSGGIGRPGRAPSGDLKPQSGRLPSRAGRGDL